MAPPARNEASGPPHIPVLLDEVLDGLHLSRGGVIVDGTFGAGGYSRAILERSACSVVAIDRDPSVKVFAQPLVDEFGKRFTLVEGQFSDMQALLKSAALTSVDGIVLDIGVSSMHVDRPERGFSYMQDGPLDMRMSGRGDSAFDLVNSWAPEDLAHIFRLYSDERQAKRIAAKIVTARAKAPIARTFELRQLIAATVGQRNEIASSARVFQALRIAVNDELGELRRVLVAAEIVLAPEARLCVVTFHSAEDRIVKRFIAERSGKVARVRPSRHQPDLALRGPAPSFTAISRKAITARAAEIAGNGRARSAKLRVAVRTQAPGWGAEGAF
ncbi:MAG: 16S rRNA (cytosine(1402)-N(4))-methyltransferase RsmH [Pseudomonadota bacterium]